MTTFIEDSEIRRYKDTICICSIPTNFVPLRQLNQFKNL